MWLTHRCVRDGFVARLREILEMKDSRNGRGIEDKFRENRLRGFFHIIHPTKKIDATLKKNDKITGNRNGRERVRPKLISLYLTKKK